MSGLYTCTVLSPVPLTGVHKKLEGCGYTGEFLELPG